MVELGFVQWCSYTHRCQEDCPGVVGTNHQHYCESVYICIVYHKNEMREVTPTFAFLLLLTVELQTLVPVVQVEACGPPQG